ncbi:hypothetical protein EV647_3869 [Kribbella sp. VKM Ac-2566]|nr:hypothetical protein EV647_3869 [Kribbella sp. VKM Ac-2566]
MDLRHSPTPAAGSFAAVAERGLLGFGLLGEWRRSGMGE